MATLDMIHRGFAASAKQKMPSFTKQLVTIVLVIAAAMTSSVAFNFMLVALTVYALLGPPQIVRAAALSITLRSLNPGLASYDSTAALLFWVLLIAVSFRSLPLVREKQLKLLAPIWAFSFVAALLSYTSSPAVSISMMKITTFAVVVPAILAAFLVMSEQELQHTKQWFAAFALAVGGLSALTLLSPGIAHARVPGSLQGIFSHPQTLGVFMAPMAAWALAGLIAMRGNARRGQIATVVLMWMTMLLTLSRTAAIAAVSSVLLACLVPVLARARKHEQASTGRIAGIILVGALALAMIGVMTGKLGEAVQGFVLKRNATDAASSLYESRGAGILSQWRNFLARPLLGNGFGVFADGEFPAGIVEVHGIPISAPVEKGFTPTAVLEETGVMGGCLFMLMLGYLAREAHKNFDLRWVAAFWAAIIINIGEAVILSPGGVGLYVWIVLGLCVASGRSGESVEPAAYPAAHPGRVAGRFSNLMP